MCVGRQVGEQYLFDPDSNVPVSYTHLDVYKRQEYILCSYLAKLLPSDKTQTFDLDNRVKLEYYRLEKTYEGAIELEATPGSWKPTQPKRAGGQKDRLSPVSYTHLQPCRSAPLSR